MTNLYCDYNQLALGKFVSRFGNSDNVFEYKRLFTPASLEQSTTVTPHFTAIPNSRWGSHFENKFFPHRAFIGMEPTRRPEILFVVTTAGSYCRLTIPPLFESLNRTSLAASNVAVVCSGRFFAKPPLIKGEAVTLVTTDFDAWELSGLHYFSSHRGRYSDYKYLFLLHDTSVVDSDFPEKVLSLVGMCDFDVSMSSRYMNLHLFNMDFLASQESLFSSYDNSTKTKVCYVEDGGKDYSYLCKARRILLSDLPENDPLKDFCSADLAAMGLGVTPYGKACRVPKYVSSVGVTKYVSIAPLTSELRRRP